MLVRRQSLVFNSEASSATGFSAPQITDTNANPSVSVAPPPAPTAPADPPSTTEVPAPTSSRDPVTSSTPPESNIKLGTVIGACLGSFALLVLIISLVVWHTRRSRNKAQKNGLNREKWNKLSDNPRDSRRSSFESKPSLPQLSLDYEYPPSQLKLLPSQSMHLQQGTPQFVLPAHPYSSSHSVIPVERTDDVSANPFADPGQKSKEGDGDTASFYSAASNPFESVYTQPTGAQADRMGTPEGYQRSPFFAPHPDSSVQEEKWGSVGKERNVQQSFAANGSDKLGSLIAALDLDNSKSEEEKADRSIHGHLGKFDH